MYLGYSNCGGREGRGASRTPYQKSALCWDQ